MLIMNLYLCNPAPEMPAWLKAFVSHPNAICCRGYRKTKLTKIKSLEPNDSPTPGDSTSIKEVGSNKPISLDESLTKGIRLFVEKMESEDKQNEGKEDWKNFARFLDKICFVLSLLIDLTLIVWYFGFTT